jgi:hypothetical protein
MNLTLPLTPEQEAALATLTTDYNVQSGEALTPAEYTVKVVLGVVNAKVDALFDQSVKALADAAAPLSYEKRTELIAQVQTAIANA